MCPNDFVSGLSGANVQGEKVQGQGSMSSSAVTEVRRCEELADLLFRLSSPCVVNDGTNCPQGPRRELQTALGQGTTVSWPRTTTITTTSTRSSPQCTSPGVVITNHHSITPAADTPVSICNQLYTCGI